MKENKAKLCNRAVRWGLLAALAALVLLFIHFSLELSCHYESVADAIVMNIKYVLLSMLLGSVVLSVFYLIAGRLWIAELIYTLVMGTIAVINYYVILWHGTPLYFSDIKNAATAMDVLSSYSFHIYRYAAYAGAMAALSLIPIAITKRLETRKEKHADRRTAAVMTAVLGLCAAVIFPKLAPAKPMAWLWSESYHEYSYMVCTVGRAVKSDPVEKPKEYDSFTMEQLSNDGEEQAGSGEIQPDVILILNETFYDLNRVIDASADNGYLDYFYSLENVTRGYALVPSIGGGTNVSEYELLTGNSSELYPGTTPFNDLNLSGAYSAATLLKECGYSVLAAHPSDAAHYNRKYGYTELGFDTQIFEDGFADLAYSRYYPTDSSVYRNLIDFYEAMGDAPRFLYMLTIQNHGDYTRNEAELDTVHVNHDFGAYTDQINEYLTSIKMSDEALKELIDYYSTSERPVIICMVGDHCPSFAKEMELECTEDERELLLRETPFMIWSNYLEGEGDIGVISLNYLMPLLLKQAGLPLTAYYSYLTELMDDVPVMTGFGRYLTADGMVYEYDEDGTYHDAVSNALCMEYNGMEKSERNQAYFHLGE